MAKISRRRVAGPEFILLTLIFWAAAVSASFASININTDAVQKAVVFLYSAKLDGTVDEARPIGTGFFVDVPINGDPARGYRVLVTARHMVDPVWTQCSSPNPSVLYARLNKKDGSGVGFVRIELEIGGHQIWKHPADEHVDAAVIPVPPSAFDYDAFGIPVSMFPTDDEIKAETIGDPIMSAGLLPALPGVARNYPIFKFGAISNIPHENIATACGAGMPPFQVHVWLIAANLVPGNSGSPIFHVPLGGNGLVLGGTRPILLGIQSISFLGSDVAGMTPISYVYEVLQEMGFPDADVSRRGQQAPAGQSK